MSEETTYKIKIEGNGLSLDREVPKEIGEQVVVLLLTGTQAAAIPVSHVPSRTATASPPDVQPTVPPVHYPAHGNPDIAVREYLDSCQAKRVPDKITAIGQYLKLHSHQNDFDRNDLISNFEDAAESVPKNLNRDIKWTLKAGWIALKTGAKDRYYVTNSGKTAIEQNFSKEVVQKTRGLASGSGKKTAVKKEAE